MEVDDKVFKPRRRDGLAELYTAVRCVAGRVVIEALPRGGGFLRWDL